MIAMTAQSPIFFLIFLGWDDSDDIRQKAEEAEEHARRQVRWVRWAGHESSATRGLLEVHDYHWATAKQLQEMEDAWLADVG